MPTATYHLFSILEGGPNLGIYYLYSQQQQEQAGGQPVRLDADLVEWVASQKAIASGGPTQLSAGPYKYTYENNGEVWATNEPDLGQDWFLIPNYGGSYLIATDSEGKRVWTAEAPRQPIKIKSPTDEPNQLYKFVKRI